MINQGHWYSKARMGLFIHWGINTGNPKWQEKIPLYKTVEEFEQAVCESGWNADKWVKAAKKLRASYITLAIFHGALGYIKAWRSNIPGTPVTKRDILAELIEASKKEGIKVLVYIGADPANHSFFKDYPWILPNEYAKYKNDPLIDITEFETWQRVYCKEVIGELIDNYPDLAGLWFDGWNHEQICREVFGFVHSKNPNILIIRNNFDGRMFDNEDVMSLECFGKKYEPEFDFVSGTWAWPGGKECCYVMRELGDWWYYYEPGQYDKAALIRKMVTIAANGWVAKMGLGPKINGDFPGTINDFINDVDEFYTWADEAIFDTQPGGLPQGWYNGNAYCVTTKRPEQGVFYVHILLPPESKTLRIPDGGMEFENAIDLKTGERIDFAAHDGYIEIAPQAYDTCNEFGDMVIKLTVKNDARLLPFTIDNHLSPLPQECVFDAGEEKEVKGMLLYEDESTAISKGGWAAPENGRLKEYKLLCSLDGVNYKAVIEGELCGLRGVKQISFAPVKARYFLLRAINAQNTGQGHVKRFKGTWDYLPFKGVISYISDSCGIVYKVTSDGALWEGNGAGFVKSSDNVRKVFVGADENIYFISASDGIFKKEAKGWAAVGINADRAAVDRNGIIWYVKNQMLYRADSGECIEEAVKDVAAAKDGAVWYCGNGFISCIQNGHTKTWDIEKDAQAIEVPGNVYIMDGKGDVYGVSGKGTNVYIIGHGAADISSDAQGNLYSLQRHESGRLMLNKADLILR